MSESATIKKWVGHKLDTAIERRLQRLADADDVSHIAVMPDVHLSSDVCNGVVVATKAKLFPQAVGGDIGCGYLSVSLDANVTEVDENVAARIMSALYKSVPVNKHSDRNNIVIDGELSCSKLSKASSRDGRLQMGTLGRGNHFIELQSDQNGRLWLLIHSGSRAMGQLISAHHLRSAEADLASGLKFVDADSDAGRNWLNDHDWARSYAAANRIAMLAAIEGDVLRPLGMEIDHETLTHLDHNHVELETHDGNELWVHRKGAQRLLPSKNSVIPGSMGTTTYVVSGRGSIEAMNSCSHGAGRAMSRKEAFTKLSRKLLRREMNGIWFDHRQCDRLVDETPSAYKDIRKVMKAQKGLVRIVGQRKPVLSYKGR